MTTLEISSCLFLATSVICPSVYFILIPLIDICLISAFLRSWRCQCVVGARETKLLGTGLHPLQLLVRQTNTFDSHVYPVG